MQKTRIEWVKNPDGSQGYSWNPIQGLCPQGCWYCYARKIYKRFHKSEFLGILQKAGKPWMSWDKELEAPLRHKKSCGIFVCSTMELFHPDTYDSWRYSIFNIIKDCPQHRFYILTKCSENIDRSMPDNVWLGVTVTLREDMYRLAQLLELKRAKIKFVSFEPLLDPIELIKSDFSGLDWIIIGAMTGYGKKYKPKKYWIEKIVNIATECNIPIFLKDNLKEIWGEELIQEFPKEKE